MASGLIALLDDVAAIAKIAAASLDDTAAAAAKASAKAAGVVIDDAAVTPRYVHGFAADRELPIVAKIARGSLKNKLVFLLPGALLLSWLAPWAITPLLMAGGAYLCFEGAEKVHHRIARHEDEHVLPSVALGPDQEAKTISGAIRTDFILSAEIMVIALKEVIDEGFVSRAAILAVVAVVITGIVYGLVALIVKMDDVGLRMARTGSASAQRIGRGLVVGMPRLLSVLSTVGTAAMIWVGGHILLVGTDELGWHAPYTFVHSLEDPVHDVAAIGGILGWSVNTLASAMVGLAVGFAILAIMARLPFGKNSGEPAAD